jgi:thymidine kinase
MESVLVFQKMLSLTLGCMFSGKTTALIHNKVEGVHMILDYDTSDATTYSISLLHSHDGDMVHCIKTKTLRSIDISTADILSINEAQFFPDLLSFVQDALKQKKQVYVYGLDGDFQQKPFGDILSLIPFADSYTKLYATCLCGKKASFSKRTSTNTLQYAPHDTYRPSCRDCLTHVA